MTDRDIEHAIICGDLKPGNVGLSQFELRYYADTYTHRLLNGPLPDDHCDMVSVIYNDQGRVGSFLHCDRSISDVPGPTLEGIGAEYLPPTRCDGYRLTTTYLSDDPQLMRRIRIVLGDERPTDSEWDQLPPDVRDRLDPGSAS